MPNPTAIVPFVVQTPDYRTLTAVQIVQALRTLDRRPYVGVGAFTLKNLPHDQGGMAFVPFTLAFDAIVRYRLSVGAAQAGVGGQFVTVWGLDPNGVLTHRSRVAAGTTGRGELTMVKGTGMLAFGLGYSDGKHRIKNVYHAGESILAFETYGTPALADGDVVTIDRTGAYDGQHTVSVDPDRPLPDSTFGVPVVNQDDVPAVPAGVSYWWKTGEAAYLACELGATIEQLT